MWLMGPYGQLTQYVSPFSHRRSGEHVREPAPLLREIDARMVDRVVKNAHDEVIDDARAHGRRRGRRELRVHDALGRLRRALRGPRSRRRLGADDRRAPPRRSRPVAPRRRLPRAARPTTRPSCRSCHAVQDRRVRRASRDRGICVVTAAGCSRPCATPHAAVPPGGRMSAALRLVDVAIPLDCAGR